MPDIHSPQQRREPPAAPTLTCTSIDDLRRSVSAEQRKCSLQQTVSPVALSVSRDGVSGVIVGGGPLLKDTVEAVNAAAAETPFQWRRFVAYEDVVKVGGSLAWRANNPGNLRDAETKIGSVPGAVGSFAVFATLDEGRAAQRDLYLSRYGNLTVRHAIAKLTPRKENDTAAYLSRLQRAGVNLDRDVASQVDVLMRAIETNEGLIKGTEVKRIR